MTDPRVHSVEILGQRYQISTALEAEYVAQLAALVDERMRHAVELTPNGEPLQLAVLAALNLADELVRCRDAHTLTNDHIAERAGELERLLDRVLMA